MCKMSRKDGQFFSFSPRWYINSRRSDCIVSQYFHLISLLAIDEFNFLDIYFSIYLLSSTKSTRLSHLKPSMSDESRSIFAEAISTFYSHKTLPDTSTISTFAPQLVELLHNETGTCLINEICKSLTYLCTDNSPSMKIFIEHGMKNRLMHLLTHQDEVTVTAALRALRCLVLPKTSRNQGHETPGIEAEVAETTMSTSIDRGAAQDHAIQSSESNDDPIEKTETKEWMVLPLSKVLDPYNSQHLSEVDFIACQNVEIFQATSEDTNDREKEAGAAIQGQIGLRCIHCGPSPFARAQFSSVYPGSIGLLPASLRHMTSNHFRHCERIPIESRRRIHQIIHHGALSSDTRTLKKFFSDVCMRVGIVNRYPPRSGLTTTGATNTAVDTEQMSPIASNNDCTVGSIIHPMSQSMDAFWGLQDEQIEEKTPVKYPMPRQMKMESDYTINSYAVANERKDIENRFNEKTECSELSRYFQDQHGLWRCSDCIVAQYTSKVEYAVWNGPGIPPPSYAKKHRLFCPQLRAQSFFGQLTHSGTPKCAPASNTVSIHKHETPKTGGRDCSEPPVNPSSKKGAIVTNVNNTRLAQTDGDSILISKGNVEPNAKANETSAKHFNDVRPSDAAKNTAIVSKVTTDGAAKGSSVPVNYVEVHEELSQDLDESTCASKEAHYDDANYEKDAIFGDLLLPEDKVLLTEYAHFAVSMMKRAFYQPAIDSKRRSGGSGSIVGCTFVSGYPGIQCVYCVNGKNPRKFFYTKCDRLINSFSEISTHFERCKYCPPSVKARLKNLKRLRNENRKTLPRGSHSIFFRRLWWRIHAKKSPGEDNLLASPNAMCLACPEDKEWLNDTECLTRRNIEVFCATEKESVDWNALHADIPVGAGQVGLRCLSCAQTDQAKIDTNAVVYPQTIDMIRNSVRDLQEKHFANCKLIPAETRAQLKKSKSNSSPFKLVKEYYANSAKKIGLYDTGAGILLEQSKRKKTEANSLPDQNNALPPPPLEGNFQKRGLLQNQKTFDKFAHHNILPSSSFDEPLPKPSLELYIEDEKVPSYSSQNQMENNNYVTFAQSLSTTGSGNATSSTPHLPVNAVTPSPCATGLKRKHDNITEEFEVNYQSAGHSPKQYEL